MTIKGGKLWESAGRFLARKHRAASWRRRHLARAEGRGASERGLWVGVLWRVQGAAESRGSSAKRRLHGDGEPRGPGASLRPPPRGVAEPPPLRSWRRAPPDGACSVRRRRVLVHHGNRTSTSPKTHFWGSPQPEGGM